MLSVENIVKTYDSGAEAPASALDGVSMTLGQGEFLAVTGRSGSGKSTLLNIMSTLLSPDSGGLTYNGLDLTALGDKDLDRLRASDFAVIFQFHHLLPYMTALENVLLPFMRSLGPVTAAQREMGLESLARVGIADKGGRLPGSLSGGEQQRVAIARALVKNSKILFADEPTGSLDKKTGLSVMELLRDLNRDGLTIAMVTHDLACAEFAGRHIRMEDGRILQ